MLFSSKAIKRLYVEMQAPLTLYHA